MRWRCRLLISKISRKVMMMMLISDRHGQPSCRMVLLKAYDDRGFSFYSNYESRKGRELKANPRASLLFYWPLVHRQVNLIMFHSQNLSSADSNRG
jgi:pyridoxamine 5'-phosphate oxidase